jgi:PAS domain S-box-containing protein
MWADVSTSLRYDKDNKPLYFMTTVNDITDLKLAEEVLRNDEKRFRELIEALPQLYWTCRVDGPCDYLSRQWVKYTGIPESDQLGYGWLEQLHPEDREKTITAWAEKVKNGTSFDIEFRIRRYDGEYHWFKTRAVPIHDSEGRLIRWLGSNTDIDSIRKAEDQLRNYSKDLEQRVILRTEQLEAANKELEAFSYSVSHDLRAPLRSVHGFTKILLEDYEPILDDEGKRICQIISSSATQMGKLIDDLLSFSRIGRTNMNPSMLDMRSLAKAAYEEISSSDQKLRTKLKLGKLHKVFGDANLLRIIWNNLISNAIKYSSKEKISEIGIKSQIKYDSIVYSIKDNGVGFDMDYKHKLFGVFQRLHSEAEFEGNGVGLAIVQRIILKHGGKVWAEGEVGKGATFYFSLPITGDRQQASGDRQKYVLDARRPTPDA